MKRIAPILGAVVLAGCAGRNPPPPAPPIQVPEQNAILAPGVTCEIPRVTSAIADASAAQNIVVHVRGQTYALQAQIQIADGAIDLVALDGLGRRGLTVKWHDGALSVDRASWLPDIVRPADILTDIAVVFWPSNVVGPALAGCGVSLTETANGRTLSANNSVFLTVDYGEGTGWSRAAHLHNAAFGFDIDIQSASLGR